MVVGDRCQLCPIELRHLLQVVITLSTLTGSNVSQKVEADFDMIASIVRCDCLSDCAEEGRCYQKTQDDLHSQCYPEVADP